MFKKQIPLLVIEGLSCLIFGIIFKLAQLPWQHFILGCELILILTILYLAIAWLLFRKQESHKQVIEQLQNEITTLQTQNRQERADLQNYFLLWIHQIKTPLTAAQLLSKDNLILKQELVDIENYTNMALSYLKISNPEVALTLSAVPIDDLLNPLFRKYAPLFVSKHLTLNYKPSNKTVITDSQWASILIEQILSNSLKYTENGSITLDFDSKKQILTIKDTGRGIAASDLPRIFERGFSGVNGRQNQKSTGIGLFLASEIAQRLNVQLNVSSQLNQGTSIQIAFPLTY